MMYRQNRDWSLLATIVGVLLAPAFAIAATQSPQPPAPMCVNNVCSGTTSTAPQTGIKWHPGHYMAIRSRPRKPETELPYLDAIGNEAVIKGVLINWVWRDLETSKGVYDFSSIDTYVNKLRSLPAPKRLIIRIEDRGFSSATKTQVPEYMKTDPVYNGGEVPMGNGVVARIWEPAVMDRLIALYVALAKRYDADPVVEGIDTEETAIGFSSTYPAPSTHSTAALLTQLKRLVSASRAAWTHSNVYIGTNYLGSDAQMEELIKHSMNNQAVVGGPDTWTRTWVENGTRALQSDQIVRGEKGSGTDYRGTVGIKSDVEGSELGGRVATFTPSELYDVAYNIMHCNYLVWDRNDWAGGDAQKWDTGILPFIRSVGGKTYTACPKSFNGRCATN